MNIREARLTVLHTWLRLAWVTGLALGLLLLPAPIVPRAAADSVGATVAAETNPIAMAVNPVTNKIYVANFNSSSVTAIDGTDNSTDTVATGTYPRAVAVNPATNRIYIANWGTNNMTVIDGSTTAPLPWPSGRIPNPWRSTRSPTRSTSPTGVATT